MRIPRRTTSSFPCAAAAANEDGWRRAPPERWGEARCEEWHQGPEEQGKSRREEALARQEKGGCSPEEDEEKGQTIESRVPLLFSIPLAVSCPAMPSFSPMVGSDDAAHVYRGSQGASFKQTVLERLAEVAKRGELLAQYQAKYGGEGKDQTDSAGNNMGRSDVSNKAGGKRAMRVTRADMDAKKAVEILPTEPSGKEEVEGVTDSGGTSPTMPASSFKPGSANSANSSSTRAMAPKSKAAPTKAPGGWPWNATTVEGILSMAFSPPKAESHTHHCRDASN